MTTVVQPVTKTLELACPPEKAFRTFTDDIAAWWPMETHSVHGAGGRPIFTADRVYELSADGAEVDWGRVLVWDPPRRLVTTWHPGTPPDRATELELVFEDAGAGRTRLRLIHRGWDALGERAQAVRDSYESGWDEVLRGLVG